MPVVFGKRGENGDMTQTTCVCPTNPEKLEVFCVFTESRQFLVFEDGRLNCGGLISRYNHLRNWG